MQYVASIEQQATRQWLAEEWGRFRQWADESRSTSPFGELALAWHAGHLTIEEGKRIETDQQIARFLSRR